MNIQQIKLDDNCFVSEFYVLQELLPGFIECTVSDKTGNVMGRKYDTQTRQFLDEWLDGFGPKPVPLTESEQMQIETYLNSKFVADMAVLNA